MKMVLVGMLRRINSLLVGRRKTTKTKAEQTHYLWSLPFPKSDFERSHNQYKCQNYLLGKPILLVVRNLVSLCVLAYILTKDVLLKAKKASCVETATGAKSVFFYGASNTDILPESLDNGVVITSLDGPLVFDEYGKSIIRALREEYRFEYYFVLKNAIKIGRYGYVKRLYTPQSILSSCEYSFTSSILTYYCELNGIRHINIMHGEKIFDITDAFCRFSKFYVWDEHYMALFEKLRADESIFVLEKPPYMRMELDKAVKTLDYTFYLAIETDETLKRLHEVTALLRSRARTYVIRPHPRYTNFTLVEKYFEQGEIENPELVGIKESLGRTRHAVARFSTVLNQAYSCGIPVVIDDYTDPSRYGFLRDEDYIMLERTDLRLSRIFDGVFEE